MMASLGSKETLKEIVKKELARLLMKILADKIHIYEEDFIRGFTKFNTEFIFFPSREEFNLYLEEYTAGEA